MFREESTISAITVTESNSIEVRRSDKIYKGDELISEKYHRHVLNVGDNIDSEDEKVKAIALAAWA